MRPAIAALLVALLGCAREVDPGFDVDCYSCRSDGASCVYSANCPAGSICNDPIEDLFDPAAPALVCIRVLCESDAECAAPQTCTPARICEAPICRADNECAGGLACISGACAVRPTGAVACAIMTPDQSLLAGARVALTAIAIDTTGAVVPLAPFDWSSGDAEVVAIAGASAIGGDRAGTAELTATLRDDPGVTCSGLSITSFTAVGPGRVRVVANDERTGGPLTGAEVTFEAGAVSTVMTDRLGAAEGVATSTVQSVTVVKPGWRPVTVIAPGGRDLFVALAPAEDVTRAGGIHGVIDLSRTRKADIQVGLVYGARSLDLLDYRAVPGADVVPTVIDAPELGVDNELTDMPGNVVLGLGNKRFTADNLRCRDDRPLAHQMGCFLARMRAGRTAAWVMGGQVKLSQVTSLANLTGFQPAEQFDAADRAWLTAVFTPFSRDLWYGTRPFLEVHAFRKVPSPDARDADCADPAQAITRSCRADFGRYQRADLELAVPARIRTVIDAPRLPELPVERCADTMIVSRYAVLPGRGLVLVGVAGATDAIRPDCVVDGWRNPFGNLSSPLDDGQIPLHSAPLHAGLEGSAEVLTFVALDGSREGQRPRDLAILVERSLAADAGARTYLPTPRGTLDRDGATFTVTAGEDAPLTGRRLLIESTTGAWTVFAPASAEHLRLPDVASLREVLTGARSGTLQAYEMGGTYSDLWALGSSTRLDRSIDHIRAVTTTQCSVATSGPCAFD